MITVYGITSCDTVKKARRWLDGQHIQYQFHDFRQQGLDKKCLQTWADQIGWEVLLNRRSTTWRNLTDTDRQNINEKNAIKLMLAYPTLIKRPVIAHKKGIIVGFNSNEYKILLDT